MVFFIQASWFVLLGNVSYWQTIKEYSNCVYPFNHWNCYFFCVVFDLIKDVICPFSLTLHFDNFQCLSFCIGTTNKTQERETERDRDKKDINTIIRYMHYIKILVILAGTVLSLTQLLLIAREIFKLLQMSETSGDYHASMDAHVVNYTSGDITESLYNSRGTQEWHPLHTTISFLTTSVEIYVKKIEGKITMY